MWPAARKSQVELTGVEKPIYGYCDQARSLESVHEFSTKLGYTLSKRDVRGILDQWVEDRLMVSEGNWYLSLAVATDN